MADPEMLYSLKFVVTPNTETAHRVLTQEGLDLYDDVTEISCEMRPVREAGLEPALAGYIANPDIESLTITRLRNYRPWVRDNESKSERQRGGNTDRNRTGSSSDSG